MQGQITNGALNGCIYHSSTLGRRVDDTIEGAFHGRP